MTDKIKALRREAMALPLLPGVYIMKDERGTVIYVGKAKQLRNRVSQYFGSDTNHTEKVRRMVSNVDRFEYIVAGSEFEALVLECSLIKQYAPKYNILLKDDKGYPYIRLDMKQAFPKLELSNKPADDGAVYYGPFGTSLRIDSCDNSGKLFPSPNLWEIAYCKSEALMPA